MEASPIDQVGCGMASRKALVLVMPSSSSDAELSGQPARKSPDEMKPTRVVDEDDGVQDDHDNGTSENDDVRESQGARQTSRSAQLWIIPSRVGSYSFKLTRWLLSSSTVLACTKTFRGVRRRRTS